MYLKRLYERAEDGAVARDASGKPKVTGVKIIRAKELQRLTQHFIDGGIGEGWLSIARGNLVIHGEDGDVTYQIVRTPGGYFCCHCGEKIEDAGVLFDVEGGQITKGQQHVKKEHEGATSPDPTNPSGYRKEDFYTCRLIGDGVEPTKEESERIDAGIRSELIEKLGDKYRRGGNKNEAEKSIQ